MLVGILLALAGWSLSRTFELSTNQAILETKIEKLEFEVRNTEEKMSEMFDMDEEIMKQHELLFKKLEQGNIGNFIGFGWMDSFKNFLTFNRYGAYQRKSIVIGRKD